MIHINREIDIGYTKGFKFNIECVDNGQEVVDISKSRQITDQRFVSECNLSGTIDKDFHGVSTMNEALSLMATGCPEITKELKDFECKINLEGEHKRTKFYNDIVGFAPIVPLAMQGVPTSMVNSKTKKMQSKVINIYYEMGASARFTPAQFREGGKKLLSALLKLEMEGYRFNLYGFASFVDGNSADLLCIKLKDAGRPFDLKRLSFPLAHAGFFRTITWDWYYKVPGGKYRSGFGCPFCANHSMEEVTKAFGDLFHQKCVGFGLQYLLNTGEEALKKALTGGQYAEV